MIRTIAALLLFTSIVLNYTEGRAQQVQQVSGMVATAGDSPETLPSAAVLLLSRADSTVLAHATTDAQGRYTLRYAKPGIYLLQVRMLGYATQTRELTLPCPEPRIDFAMHEQAHGLDEVRVTGHAEGIKVLGDTTRYSTKVFTTGTEKTLGEVLDKLPGVSVDEQGNATADGKQVDKVLFNGTDLYGGNVAMVTQNVSADVTDSVEVIRGYSEYTLMDGFQTHDKTVINVGVKQSKLGKLTGDVTLGAGYANKAEGRIGLMLLGKQLMTSVIASGNNTGKAVLNFGDYMKFQGGLRSLMGDNDHITIDISESASELMFPPSNTYARNGLMGALNMAYNAPSEKLKLNAYYMASSLRNCAASSERYYYVGDTPYDVLMSESAKQHSVGHNMRLKVDYMPTSSFTMVYTTMNSLSDMGRTTAKRDSMGMASFGSQVGTSQHTAYTDHSLSALLRMGELLTELSATFVYSHKPETLALSTDSLQLPVQARAGSGYLWAVNQDKTLTKRDLGVELNSKYKLNEQQHLSLSMGIDYNRRELDIERDPADSLSGCNMLLNLRTLYAKGAWAKNKGLLRFNFGLAAKHLHVEQQQLSGLHMPQQLHLLPSVDISLHFTEKSRLTLMGGSRIYTGEVSSFVGRPLVLGLYSMRLPGDSIPFVEHSDHAELSYSLSGARNSRLSASIGYSSTRNEVQSTTQTYGAAVVERSLYIGPTSSLDARMRYSRDITSFWRGTVSLSARQSRRPTLHRGVANEVDSRSLSSTVSVRTSYKQGFNTAFSADASWRQVQSKSDSPHHINSWGTSGELSYKHKGWLAKVRAKYDQTQVFSSAANALLLEAELRYTPSERWEFSLFGNDLMHLGEHRWADGEFNGLYTLERVYHKLPGYVMARVTLKIK